MSQSPVLATLSAVRRLLLVILLLGFVGTATELLLIGHDEDAWQLIPLVVLALAIIATLGMLRTLATVSVTATRLFRAAMVLLLVSGAVGAVLHYRANMEFKLEMDPSLSGFALFSSVVQATTPPALAPGIMALFGLIGLASVFRLGSQSR